MFLVILNLISQTSKNLNNRLMLAIMKKKKNLKMMSKLMISIPLMERKT